MGRRQKGAASAVSDGAERDVRRTTLILDARLATALKVLAVNRRTRVNDLVIEAIEVLLSQYPEPSVASTDLNAPPRPVRGVTALLREVERLTVRVEALENRSAVRLSDRLPEAEPDPDRFGEAFPQRDPRVSTKPDVTRRASAGARAEPAARQAQVLTAKPGRLSAVVLPPIDMSLPLLDPAGVRREAAALIHARGAPIAHRELLAKLLAAFRLPGKDVSENLRTILVHPRASGFVFIRGQGYAVQPHQNT